MAEALHTGADYDASAFYPGHLMGSNPFDAYGG